MELDVPRVWIRVRAQLRFDGVVALSIQDDAGVHLRAPSSSAHPVGWEQRTSTLPGLPPVPVLRPVTFPALVRSAVDRLQRPRSGTWPARVPIFVNAPRELDLLPWNEVLAEIVGSGTGPAVPPERWVTVAEPERAVAAPLTRLRLPVRVLLVGDAGSRAHASLATNPWLRSPAPDADPAADVAWVDSTREAVEQLRSGGADILLLDAATAATLPRREAPVRLVIVLGTGSGSALEPLAVTIPWARNLLVLPGPAGPPQAATVDRLLISLSHDLPLHEAVADATRPGPAARLVASPDSIHDLRLTAIWEGVERDTTRLEGTLGSADLREVTARLGSASPVSEWVERSAPTTSGAVLPELRNLGLEFVRESRGLHPLAVAQARLQRVHELVRHLDVASPQLPDVGAETRRVVNLGLRRASEVLAPLATSTYVGATRTLAAGADYSLDVQVGAPWRHSLVVGEVPPIDLLLPDTRSRHELSISLFSDSFMLTGPTTQRVNLPPRGASGLVTFGLRAPVRRGAAWLRISVYHRDNLLQTFLLRARVDSVEQDVSETVLVAELQHAATSRWDDIDELGSRALSIAVNDNGEGHQIFIKQDDITATAALPVDALAKQATDFRLVLASVVQKTISASDAVWQLARLGERLRLALFNAMGPTAQQALASVSRRSDLTLQVVRVHAQVGLPWSLVYDWRLPRYLEGAPRPPVCLGTTDGADCSHQAGDGAVCIKGFWGIRHHVEELLPEREDRPRELGVAVDPGGVLVAMGVADLSTQGLAADLASIFPPTSLRALSPADTFVPAAFGAERPGVVVLLGQLKHDPAAGEPQGDRIAIGTVERWLQPDDISWAANDHGAWSGPRPLVLLLACGSAAVTPTELTSFLAALDGAAAGAIIGTECDIYSDLARTFTTTLLRAMRGTAGTTGGRPSPPLPFGAAVAATRRELVLEKGDVRGLVFDALGPAELVLT